jgi:hypothetical protein
VIDALHAALRRARRAWWGAAVAWSAVFAATGFALTAALFWLRAFASGASAAPLPGDWLPIAAVVAAATTAATLLVSVRLAPSLLVLARAADRRFATLQRLSTAFEILRAGPPTNALERALVRDAEHRAAALAWGALGRERWPKRPLVATLPALALLTAAWYLPLPTPSERAVTSAASTRDDSDQRARDASTLSRFASVLAEVGERERSPYLQAVAASYDDVARRLAEGTLDAEAAARALEELAGHLERAANDVSAAFAQEIRASLTALAGGDDTLVAGGGDPVPGRADPPPADAGSPAAVDPASAAAAAGPQADASMYTMLADLANEIANNPGNLGLRAQRPPPGPGAGLDEAFYGGVMRAQTDPDAGGDPGGMRVDAPGGGEAVGAADRSSERAGDAAGAGGAELGADAAFLALDAASEAVTALPWSERDDGAFVEVELVPDAVLGSARAFTRAGNDAPYARGDEAASVSRAIGVTYRDVVGRYFLPGALATEGRP